MNIMTDIDVLLEVDYHKSYGMQTEYDRFWDAYQENGNRTNYKYAFAGPAWSKETFKPKYDLVPVAGNNMFYSSNIGGDFVELLDNLGIKLDLSKVTGLSATFGYSYFTHLGIIDTSSSTTCYQMFVGCPYLVTIDKLILRTDGIQSFSNCFSECKSLENIIFEGVIGQNTFSMQWCTKLSKKSIISAINALSTKTTGYAAPFSLVAVNTAFETSEGAADGSSSEEWETLVATKPNWIISLI